MAEIKLYRNGKTKSMWGERGATLLESKGWSRTAPAGTPSYTPRLTPAEQNAQKYKNVSQNIYSTVLSYTYRRSEKVICLH